MDTSHGNPPVDGDLSDMRQLRHALGRFATGVTIVTTREKDGQSAGVTVNSFASLSLDPPLVLWSLKCDSRSLDRFRNAGGFAVNVLAGHQSDLARRFSSGQSDRFEGVACSEGDLGMPLLHDALAWFECSTISEHEAGDHVLFVGEVVSYKYADDQPLLYYRGDFARLAG